ncbi:hypothetical protein COCMIDRAFT_66731, partial [Bipolaris oryzae ATCC 44560]
GCFTDGVPRVLTGKTENSNLMARERCENFCKGYTFYGLHHSTHCFCGNRMDNPTKSTPEAECNMRCAGNSEMCRG